jgi:hypothetical protein
MLSYSPIFIPGLSFGYARTYQYYNSEDMEQMILNPHKEDIDPSIKLLAKRNRKIRRI